MFYTSETLVSSVKARTLAPNSQTTFQDSDILNFANEEMQIKLVAYMLTMREDYFLRHEPQTILTNVTKYTLPRRAIGNDVKDVFFIDSNNNRFILPRVNIHDLPVTGFIPDLYPNHFYVYGDQLVLAPMPSSAQGQIDMWYYQKPSQLIPTANCAKVTSVSFTPGTSILTVDTDITTNPIVDILSGKSPFQLWTTDAVVTYPTSTTISIQTSDIANEAGSASIVSVGDYVCPQLQCNIPMIPEEFHPLLAEVTSARILQALGDANKLQQAMANVAEMKMNIQNLMANRTEQAGEKLINRYGLNRLSGTGYFTSWIR